MLRNTPGDPITLKAKHIHPTIENYKPIIKDNGHIADTAFIDELQVKL